jgi:energy-coupling factor transporter transmembrane protein EcfT
MKPGLVIAFLLSCVIGILYITNPEYEIIIIAFALFCVIASTMIMALWLLDGKFKLRYTTGFLPLLFVMLFSKAFKFVQQKQAVKVQSQIEVYGATHKKFPIDLRELNTVHLKTKFSYKVDSNRQKYELEYDLNGRDRMHYDSQSKEWSLLGPYD